jgi:hypothetical protein
MDNDDIETYECSKCEEHFGEDEYEMFIGLCTCCMEDEYVYPKVTKAYIQYTEETNMYPCGNCDKILEEEFDFRRQYEGAPYHTEMDTHLCQYCCQQYDKYEYFDDFCIKNEAEDEANFIPTVYQEVTLS